MVERELNWRTSSYSGTEGNCVEVALTEDRVYVRDTKDRDGGVVEMTREQWSTLVRFTAES